MAAAWGEDRLGLSRGWKWLFFWVGVSLLGVEGSYGGHVMACSF